MILSRGSNDLHVVDLVNWEVISEYGLTAGAGGKAPVPMDIELLANGQVLVVFNNSDRLRIIDVDDNYQFNEVIVPGATVVDQGFHLPRGRAIPRTDGTFSVFLATPSEHGIVSLVYDPAAVNLAPAVDENGVARPTISRSPFSGPHVGGRTVKLTTSHGTEQSFYLSTDRNGFLTWVNAETYAFGFLDLVSYIDDASRDESSNDYKNPNDSHVDPSRIVDLEGNNIAVLNNRAKSVVLSLEIGPNDDVGIREFSPFDRAYGATLINTLSGTKLYSTAGSEYEFNIGTHYVVISDMKYDSASDAWSTGEFESVATANPVSRAVATNDDGIILELHGTQRRVVSASGVAITNAELKLNLSSADGIPYTDEGAPSATYLATTSNRLFMTARLSLPGSGDETTEYFLAIVDITSLDTPTIHSTYPIPSNLRWYSVALTSDRVSVLDRLGGEVLTITGWTSPGAARRSELNFGLRQPSTYGRIRSARMETLPDGTDVVVHDTSPDKVMAVFESGQIGTQNPLPQSTQLQLASGCLMHTFWMRIE